MEISYVRLSTIVVSLFAGVILSVLAKRLKVPVIAPLLLGGIILGPEMTGIIDTSSLGTGLRLIISLSVATILFEGGIALDLGGFRKAGKVITKLLSIGVLVTWLGTSIAIYLIFNLSMELSLTAGSLVIVTGPTVINPLLQRIRVKENLHHILHWEGVLIDPIGVFISILCIEWISIEGHYFQHIYLFVLRIMTGVGIGILGGYLLVWILNRKFIAKEQVNIFVFASAIFLFGISDFFAHEAGILTVVVAGFILGWKKPSKLKDIHMFKSELTEMAIGVLFILLSANLKLSNFVDLGFKGILIVAVVLYIVRPLNIYFSSLKSDLTNNEIAFLSWISPRGVVAGSMASLFTLRLTTSGIENATFLESFTFSVIGVSILIQGTLSEPVARFLKVKADPKRKWLIIGAHYFSRKIASYITRTKKGSYLLVDTNAELVNKAKDSGFEAMEGNALSLHTLPEEIISNVGFILALTDNRDLNQLICEKWSEYLPSANLFRWAPSGEEISEIDESGVAVWSELSKPSKVAYDLETKESIIIRSKIKNVDTKLIKGTVPLLMQKGEDLFINDFELQGDGDVLLYQKISNHLPFYVHSEHILDLDIKNTEQLLRLVLNEAVKSNPEIDFRSVLNSLTDREDQLPTVLGNGVAVPHAYSENLKEPVCIVARVKNGIELNAYDKEISKLFFVLISPKNDPEIHLILLSDIAKIASNIELVERLMTVSSDEIKKILMAN